MQSFHHEWLEAVLEARYVKQSKSKSRQARNSEMWIIRRILKNKQVDIWQLSVKTFLKKEKLNKHFI